MSTVSIKDIKKLSVAERILLVERIWETIPEKSNDLTLTAEQEKELNQRARSVEMGTAKLVTWNQVRKNLRGRRK